MIGDDQVEEVRARADIVEIVAEHVQLKRSGREFRGLCPFHQERTPSFYVVPGKGFYKCFGCGESGDVFSFLMKRHGLGFLDAVREVARKVGVELREESGGRAEEPHRELYEAVSFAADFFRQQLWDEQAGESARRYLDGRGVGRDASERFGLGYAPDGWRTLLEAARGLGIEVATLLEAGLVKEPEPKEGEPRRVREPYDRFRHRLIFPIPELRGRYIAFSGRTLERAAEGVPKYLNSPETPIFRKGDHLYGLHWARGAIRREERVLVVEGQMDYVSLAARGVENVVAGLGTAMTPEQAGLLARYAKRALLLYDSDEAGVRASFRTADALLRAGVHPLVVTLPEGEDPDSLVRKGGAAALAPVLDGAADVLDRKLAILEERGYFGGLDTVRQALDRLLPTLRATADPTLRDLYVDRVSRRTGVRRETLEAELAIRGGGSTRPDRPPPPQAGQNAEQDSPGLAGERKLLLLLLKDADRVGQAAQAISPDELADPVYRELFEALLARYASGTDRTAEAGATEGAEGATAGGAAGLETDLGEAARARLAALRADRENFADGDKVFQDAIGDIRAERVYHRMDELDRQIRLAYERGADDEVSALTVEKSRLAKATRGVERMIRSRAGRREPGT
jgi:DNA primase